MNKKILLLVLVLLLILIALYVGQNPPMSFLKNKTGLAPDFTLHDIYGKKFQLSSQRGYPVVIFFGTTWCPQCRSEMKFLKARYDQYVQRGLKIIYIDINESVERVSRFTQQNSYPGVILLDLDGSVAYEYGVQGVPTIILVDATGTIKGEGRTVSDLSLNVLFPDNIK
ncbi:MAG: TlpA family protein disulfide reductase [Syntrophaceae bacterium]|nr:TlpA family protein disulfide reductase [Syntrophaceae bacterium]